MQIKPNRTILRGRAERICPADGGYGANVDFRVSSAAPARGFSDFTGAEPGSTITLFTPDGSAMTVGAPAKVTASVLGGPFGERYVIEKVDEA